jgi:hypothetical protein
VLCCNRVSRKLRQKEREKVNKQEKQELQEQAESYARQIHAKVTEQGGSFEVVIHKTSESNLTWYYSVNLWYFDDKQKRVRCWCLNYVLSQYLGFGTLKDERHLKSSGVGTERSFLTAYILGGRIARILDFESFGEDVTTRYGVEYRKDYGYIYTDKVTLVC